MVDGASGSPGEKNWQVLEQRAISANPWFRVLQSRVRMPDARETTYFTLDFPKAAVGVIPRRGGEVLLIRQYRFIVDSFVWAIPSGGAEKSEDLEDAARRELLEETGYHASSIRSVLRYFPSYGCGNQEFHLFEAEVSGAGGTFDRNEVLEVKWFPTAEVKEMLFANRIVDGLSLTPLLLVCAREAW